ncbi:branched-chain amino acid ABC transporter permease [Microbacterium sp. MYb54]|nr:branched-chain amino acid ABC transporter permease [Microbacterium sp. MYb43]PQZ81575.1 branched-chain amino acid ABC transporter permease [Microbacterium sp. MYb40]PRB21571.1 branched-chain amino acid ABC transporter permease [Microbacterium sp. MYb54]PRB30122.1 branched-chain amino acid ABC transporter permease [Microbacterium sp. MYb50]PRB67929.1 branched-chain amino acid ABC transporter permease [Microbacterium sp. MYb24]PRB76418.1 branched-chain amino acid ABC transporter permease [Mic
MVALLAILMALTAFVFLPPSSASAETTDDGQEVTEFYLAGVVTFDDQPVEGVVMSIDGKGFKGETETDAEGKWRLYVPEKAKYTLTVDESTLPDGVIVDASLLPPGTQPISGTTASFEVEFGLTGTKIMNLFLGEGERVTVSFIDQLLSRLVGGLNFGLLLALASMGAALIYGTTRLSNFAHAEMVTWGGLVALVTTTFWHLPLWVGIAAAVIGGGLFGWALDAGLWRPLRRRGLGVVQLMIVSIGLSLALRYVFQFMIGGGTYQLPGASPTPIQFGPISLSYIDIIAMSVSIVVIIAVAFFLTRTRIGKATRAISDNPQLAAASGIDVDKVIRYVWILAGTLAAISGVLWGYFRPGVKWDMGMQMLLLIFAAITLGGLGTAFGALVGSLIVGIAVEVSTLWIPSDLKYASALVVLIVILLVRPQGLLGRRERLG